MVLKSTRCSNIYGHLAAPYIGRRRRAAGFDHAPCMRNYDKHYFGHTSLRGRCCGYSKAKLHVVGAFGLHEVVENEATRSYQGYVQLEQ
jgi:hypothetical protein